MPVLILGVLIWALTHSIKHTAPRFRHGLGDNQAKGLVSAAALVAIVLMVIGYRSADPVFLYDLGPWTTHLNNLLMVIAVALVMANSAGSRIITRMRHPMLTALVLWAAAHLLVAGDLRAVILFGGLAAWAIATMAMTNRRDPHWKAPKGSAKGDLILVGLTVLITAIAIAIHIWAGLSPFGVSTL